MDTIILNNQNYDSFIEYLKGFGDEAYKSFSIRIIPEIGPCYGVRMPVLKDIAKRLSKNDNISEIVGLLHLGQSYEERILEGCLLPYINFSDDIEILKYIDMYIPRIDNWAVNDSFAAALRKLVLKRQYLFYHKALECIRSSNPYEVRFGLVLLNDYFSSPQYIDAILPALKNIKTGHYYVNMGIAWLVSTLYLSDKKRIIKFLKEPDMDIRCINKSIQKIIESRKVPESEKDYLKTLKRK